MSALEVVREVQSYANTPVVQARPWSLYERWCEAQGLEPLRGDTCAPSPEQCLLLFLQANSDRRWSYGTLRIYTQALAAHYMASGREDPRGPRTRAYLDTVLVREGALRERPTDAFTLDQIRALRGARAGIKLAQPVPTYRALAALLDVGGLEASPDVVSLLASITPDDVNVTEACVTVGRGPVLIRVPRSEFPMHYAAVMGASATLFRWLPLPQGPFVAVDELRLALDRAHGVRGPEWLDHIDKRHRRVAQVLAYLSLGFFTGHRHAELASLTVGMLQERPGGTFAYTLNDHKGNKLAGHRGGTQTRWHVEVVHMRENGECAPYCPACALGEHLAQRRADGAKTADYLFVAPDGRSPFHPNAARKAVALAWHATREHSHLNEGVAPNLGTRSLRVTAASLALDHGMSLVNIARLLHHRDISTTARYIRRFDEMSVQDFTLPL